MLHSQIHFAMILLTLKVCFVPFAQTNTDTKHPKKSLPILHLPSLLIKSYVSEFVALGTVPPPSGPETLEPWVTMVMALHLMVYSRNMQ